MERITYMIKGVCSAVQRIVLAGLLFSAAFSTHADYLRSGPDKQRLQADIKDWSLDKVLQELSTATGWEIYVEPTSSRQVSSKFTNVTYGEALPLVLGKLSFALLPQTNGPSKLFVFQSNIQEATKLVKPLPRSKSRIGNELLVTLKPGSSNIAGLAGKNGAKIVGKIDGLNAYRLRFEDESAATATKTDLDENPDVQETDYNQNIQKPPTAERLASASMQSLDLKPSPPLDADPNRLVIGLIDQQVQTAGNNSDLFLLPGISVAENGGALDPNSPSHGTSMYQTILKSLAALSETGETRARVLPVDIYGTADQTSTFQVANGIYEAVNKGANIINLSLGGETDSAFLHNVIKNAQGKGVLFFGAAGNEPTSSPTYPAAYEEVIAVTAGDRRGNVASYANRGDFVDIIAPGATVVHFGNQSYLISGTSAATAYSAGVAAALAEQMNKPPREIEAEIRRQLSIKPGASPGK